MSAGAVAPSEAPTIERPPAAGRDNARKSRGLLIVAIVLGVIAAGAIGALVGGLVLAQRDSVANPGATGAVVTSPAPAASPVGQVTPPQATAPTPAPTTSQTPAPVPTTPLFTPTEPPPAGPSSVPVQTPYWTVIVASTTEAGGGLARAQEIAARLQGGGYAYDIFESAAYSSLSPGYWVTATGRFASEAAAESFEDTVQATGYSDAYAKCVGTASQCGG